LETAIRKAEPLTGPGPRRRCLPGVVPHSLSLRGGTASSNPASSSAEPATNQSRGVRRSCGALTHRLVRVLGAIVGPQPSPMTAGQAQNRKCGGTGAQLVGDCQLGRKAVLLEQFAHRFGTLALAVGAACDLSLHVVSVTRHRFSRSTACPCRPASEKWWATISGCISAISGNCFTSTVAMRVCNCWRVLRSSDS